MKLRVSYSLLLLWSQGRHEEAVSMYLHKDTKKSQAMEDGISLHRGWASSIRITHRLRLGDTDFAFVDPEVEYKRTGSYSDQFDMSGTFDCIDGKTIYEFKSGVASSLEYSRGYQLPFYFLMAEILEIPVEKGIIAHYNQYKKKSDCTIVYNNKKQIDRARNFIDSIAPEIYQYFMENGISVDKNIKTK